MTSLSPSHSRLIPAASFANQVVVFTGRLAALSRKEACVVVQRLGGEAADDQVNKLRVFRAAIEDRQIVLRDIGKVDLGSEAEILLSLIHI